MPRIKKTYTGLNIQHPYARWILQKSKTIETRTYPLPKKYEDVELLIIETPGDEKTFAARAIGKVVFGKSFQYKSKKDFKRDFQRHKVSDESQWCWRKKKKWGWPVKQISKLKRPHTIKKRKGIVFTLNITI